MSAQSEARLIQAVHTYLDGLQFGQEGWPEELATLTAYGFTSANPAVIDRTQWRDLTLTADQAYLSTPMGDPEATAVRAAVKAVLLALGYTVEEES